MGSSILRGGNSPVRRCSSTPAVAQEDRVQGRETDGKQARLPSCSLRQSAALARIPFRTGAGCTKSKITVEWIQAEGGRRYATFGVEVRSSTASATLCGGRSCSCKSPGRSLQSEADGAGAPFFRNQVVFALGGLGTSGVCPKFPRTP